MVTIFKVTGVLSQSNAMKKNHLNSVLIKKTYNTYTVLISCNTRDNNFSAKFD